MQSKGLVAVAALALIALAGPAALAGGPDCHHGKEATAAKHDCTMSAEECATAHKAGACSMSSEECAAEMKKSYATRGWLGVEKEKTADRGMVVTRVHPGSPAEQAGFQVGDQFVSINGAPVATDKEKAHQAMKNARIGDTLTYVVARGGEQVTLQATLATIPDSVLEEMVARHIQEGHKVAKN
jgi:predicted metalloprotease with PDZ domain